MSLADNEDDASSQSRDSERETMSKMSGSRQSRFRLDLSRGRIHYPVELGLAMQVVHLQWNRPKMARSGFDDLVSGWL